MPRLSRSLGGENQEDHNQDAMLQRKAEYMIRTISNLNDVLPEFVPPKEGNDTTWLLRSFGIILRMAAVR